MGEGAGVLVLEAERSAAERAGADVLGECSATPPPPTPST